MIGYGWKTRIADCHAKDSQRASHVSDIFFSRCSVDFAQCFSHRARLSASWLPFVGSSSKLRAANEAPGLNWKFSYLSRIDAKQFCCLPVGCLVEILVPFAFSFAFFRHEIWYVTDLCFVYHCIIAQNLSCAINHYVMVYFYILFEWLLML